MRRQREQPGYVLLRRSLEDGQDHSVTTAVALLGLHRHTCREYLQLLHGDRLTHVLRWQQTNQRGDWYPVYRWGKGDDAPKPGREERLERRRLKRTVDTKGITIHMLLGQGRLQCQRT